MCFDLKRYLFLQLITSEAVTSTFLGMFRSLFPVCVCSKPAAESACCSSPTPGLQFRYQGPTETDLPSLSSSSFGLFQLCVRRKSKTECEVFLHFGEFGLFHAFFAFWSLWWMGGAVDGNNIVQIIQADVDFGFKGKASKVGGKLLSTTKGHLPWISAHVLIWFEQEFKGQK